MSESAPHPNALLNDRDTLEFTVQVLTDHFDLQANGYRCQTPDLWHILLAAAAQRSTIEATCRDLQKAPDSNTVRGYLQDQFTPKQVRPLEECFNRALASQLPRWFVRQLRRGLDWAIDLHDVPYYGKIDRTAAPPATPPATPPAAPTAAPADGDCWVCRGEAQRGTTRFYRCATAYVMLHDQRWTLAVTFVHPEDKTLTVLERLQSYVHNLGFRIV